MRQTLLSLFLAISIASCASAVDVEWTGSLDQDIFNAGNYLDLATGLPATVGPANNVAFDGNLTYNSAGTLVGFPAGFSGLNAGTGVACFFGTTVDAFSGGVGSTGGFRAGVYELYDSTASLQFTADGGLTYVDGTSELSLAGGGNPINGAATQIFLDQGASLSLSSLANFSTNQNNGSKIFFADGAGALLSVNDHLAAVGGATITDLANAGLGALDGNTFVPAFAWADPWETQKVPEPGSLALMLTAMAGLALIRRR